MMNNLNNENLEEINRKTREAYNLAAQKYFDLFYNEMDEKEYDRKLLDKFSENFKEDSLICDAGCGPAAHIGRYVFEKGIPVVGVDISDKCVELAKHYNPDMIIERADIGSLPFGNESLDGIISYYSIIDTPRKHVGKLFSEFRRVLKPGGYLLVVVKAGNTEGYMEKPLDYDTEIWFTFFQEEEMKNYFNEAEFNIEFFEKRSPYDFEIDNERIYAIGRKKR